MVPGLRDLLPGLLRAAGRLASALAVVLMVLVLVCVLPIQWLTRDGRDDRRRAARSGPARLLLVLLMAITLLPFVSLFATALHPSGTYPPGLDWPSDPQWGNFADAFRRRAHGRAAEVERRSSCSASCPASLLIAHDGRLRHRSPADARAAGCVFLVFLLGLTLPFEGIITPLYYQVRDMGLLNTRWAIILPLIGLFMPFSVFWMRAHFVNMPDELSEAARIDGANTWQLFWRIHVPLAMPGDLVAGDPAVPLDVEPVPAGDRAGRRPDEADDGRRAGRLPGPVGHRHPAALRRLAADPDADARRLRDLPAPFVPALLQGSLKG